MNNRKIADINAVIEYLKQHIDITDVIGEVADVEKAGKDTYKALCCFHDEKTPSLVMTPSKGLYHCFGCKESGDIITFYRKRYNYSTIEAIYKLAENYNMNIRSFERDLTPEEKQLNEYQAIMKQIQAKMTSNLLTPNNNGRKRLEDRDINEELWSEFGLGYSANIAEVASGIDSKYIEILQLDKSAMYEDAIIYPLYDGYGQIVGIKTRPSWGGRFVDTMGRKFPKFMGTSIEFPLHVDDSIYGFHIARKHLVNGELILVEGQHDVLSMHQAGIKNVAGTDGTALNEPKLQMLKEFGVRKIKILYDGDNAGLQSSTKIAEEAIKQDYGISIKIARLPDGIDPDEAIRAGNLIAVKQALNEAVYGSQFIIDNIFRGKDIKNITVKMDIVKEICPILNNVSALERSFIISYVASKLNILEYMIEDVLRYHQDKSTEVLLHNIDGEKAVLGEMIRNQDFRLEALTEIRDNDFFLGKHQIIFQLINTLVEQDIDIQIDTLKMIMNNKGYKQILNDGEYFEDLLLSFGEVKVLKEDIIDKAIRRRLSDISQRFNTDILDLKQKAIISIESVIEDIEKATTCTTDKMTTAEIGAKDFMDRLHDRMQNPNRIVGIGLGDNMKTLTKLINGVQNKKLITVSANQSVGKTTLLCNWLNEIGVTQKKPWVHFSLEMTSDEIVNKVIGIRAGVNTQKIEMGNITNEEYKRIQQATIEYHEGNLILIDDQTTLEQISNTVRKLIRTNKIVGVSIDYVQLMHIERSKNKQRYEELGDISGILKNDVAKKLDIPVIILSQLGRSALQKDIATAEDGAGSYKIAQDSDIYITLKEKSAEDIEEQGGIEFGNLILNLDKNRGGRADVLLDIYFQKDIQRMIEVDQ